MKVIPETRLSTTFVIYVIIIITGSIPLLADTIRQIVSASELTWFVSVIVITVITAMGDLCRSCLDYLALTQISKMTWLSSLLIMRVPAKSWSRNTSTVFLHIFMGNANKSDLHVSTYLRGIG